MARGTSVVDCLFPLLWCFFCFFSSFFLSVSVSVFPRSPRSLASPFDFVRSCPVLSCPVLSWGQRAKYVLTTVPTGCVVRWRVC